MEGGDQDGEQEEGAAGSPSQPRLGLPVTRAGSPAGSLWGKQTSESSAQFPHAPPSRIRFKSRLCGCDKRVCAGHVTVTDVHSGPPRSLQ